MTLKLKNPETILMMLLKEKFLKDLREAKLCLSDMVGWILKDEKQVEERFEAWLVQNGYAETPVSIEDSYRYNTLAARSTLHPGKTLEEVEAIIEENIIKMRNDKIR
jgi:hypothetical protein